MKGIILSLAILSLIFQPMQAAEELPAGVKIGDKAPDFMIMNVDSLRITLSTYRDAEGLIVVFTCNHCPFSKAYEDRIIELHNTYASQGWPVLAINPNDPTIEPEDSFEKMQERAKEKKYPFAYAFDATQSVAKAYGARRTPHVFLLRKTKAGFIVEYIGAIDDSPRDADAVSERFVQDAIAALKAGKAPSSPMTKAIGCTIKWKQE